ncbi:uncharacterized protein LOC141537015 [Cotesia typhae]|uniref:uncharacterized protein LOC141537015 n=1 Tax=Cotesia typhae TaxID=2053667 RepID=UPI003D6930F4
MIGLRGQRLRTLRFLHDGHMYHHDARYNNGDEDYVCSLRTSRISRCPVIASVHDDGEVEVVGIHTHGQRFSAEELRKQEMVTELKRRAVASNEPPNEILNAVSREFIDIADIINPVSARAIINRERIQLRPPMPQTVHHVGPMLDRYLQAAEIYRGEIQASDGSIAIVFGSQRMLERLNETVELFVDGPFQAIPDQPRFMQLLIIHCRKLDMGLPALFILCEKRTTAIYEKIWEYILDRSPEMENNLKYVSGDFEKAAISAVRNKMRWVIFRGCWFHFTRAVTRRWRRLRLIRAPEAVLHLTWVLPLVPAYLFQEAFEIIRTEARVIERDHPQRLNSIIRDEEIKWRRLDQGHDLAAERRAYQASVDSRIRNYQIALDNGRFTVAEFLRTVGLQRVHVAVADANIRLQDEQFDSDDEMPLLRDLADPVGANENLPVLPALPPIREARRHRRRGARRGGGVEVGGEAVINNQQIGGRGRPRGRPRGARGGRQVHIPPIAAGIEQNQPVIIEGNVVERIKTQEEEWITRASSFVKPKRQFLQLTRLRQYLLEEAFTVKDFLKATLNREVTDLISNEIIRNDVIFDNIDLTIPHFENRHQDVARPEEDDTTNGADNDDGAREAVVVNRGNCSICLTASSTIVVLPCFHLCLYMPCNTMMQHHYNRQLAENEALYPTCPVCRTRIDSTREVYTT